MKHPWILLSALVLLRCGAAPRAADNGDCSWPPPSSDSGGACSGGPTSSGPSVVVADLPGGRVVHRNLTYGTRGGRVLQADLYLPDTLRAGRRPGTLILIHGGGWQDCTRRRAAVAWYADALSSVLKVGVLNVEYRLTQEGGGYPESLGDVKCAAQWMASESARFGLDGTRLAMAGESAGATLAVLAALTEGRADLDPGCGTGPARLSAAIAYSGAYDLPLLAASSSAGADAPVNYAGPCRTRIGVCESGRACDRCVDASPLAHACGSLPRIVLVHAPPDYDALIPVDQAQRMQRALADAGNAADLVVPGDAALRAEGCQPNVFARQAHGLINTCLTTPSGPTVARVLVDALMP